MKRWTRKLIVPILSAAIIMGIPMFAFAEESKYNTSGIGRIEAISKPDVYQVILPTDVNGIFDFVFDPQKLIEETDAAAYGGTSFEKGATVYFHRSDGQVAEEYSSSSDHVTIINRSTVPVDIQIDVAMSTESLSGITMTADRSFTNDASTSLYLALIDGEYTVPVGTENSCIRTTLPAAPEEAFEYGYDQEQGKYTCRLKEDLNGIQFPEYSFQLTGAVNEKGNWAELGNVSPLVNVTWKVTPGQSIHSDAEKHTVSDVFRQTLETEPIKSVIEDQDTNLSNTTDPAGVRAFETIPETETGMASEKDIVSDVDIFSEKDKADVEKNISIISTDSEENTAPKILKTLYPLKSGKSLSIEVDLGKGESAATKVASVRWKKSDEELLGMSKDSDMVKYEKEKILFSKEWVDEYLAEPGEKSAVLVIIFDDAGATRAEVMLDR